MRKVIAILLCFISISANAWKGKKEAALQSDLNQEFVGKSFLIRTQFGSFIAEQNMMPGHECNRLIDTEYRPDGTIRYLRRKGCYSSSGTWIGDIFSTSAYVDESQLTSALKAGTSATVQKVEIKDDRIEFSVSSRPGSRSISDYAKLKLYIAGGTREATLEKVMAAASEVLYIEKYEKQRELRVEFENLSSELPKLQSQYGAGASVPSQKAKSGHALRDQLQKLITNRSSVSPPDTAAASQFQAQLAALDKELPAIDAAARAERIESVKAAARSNQEQCAQLKASLDQKHAATLAQWQARSDSVSKSRQLLEQRKDLASQLAQEGETAQDILNGIASENQALDKISEGLNSEHKQLRLAQLNADFQAMEKRKIALLDAYTRAFGSPSKEHTALNAVRSHLQTMLQNRKEAKALGYDVAARQASQVEAEIAKLSRR
ncbi:MAG: hypothetical protein LAP21_19240 [Acidobacteriia bacterium]|nr:hypothetical protein [Terriglobia bacterium]